jgi:hypothetical protein
MSMSMGIWVIDDFRIVLRFDTEALEGVSAFLP